MTLPKLTASAPEGLVLIPESDWTEYEKRIWDGFDAYADSVFQGTGPHNDKVAIGRLNNRPAIIARIAYATESEEMGLWSEAEYYRTLNIGSTVFTYPEESRETHWEDMDCYDADILEGDGEYDVLKDEVPEAFLSDVKEMFQEPRVWVEYENELKLGDYIKEQVGGVDKIADAKVRAHIIEVIAKEE